MLRRFAVRAARTPRVRVRGGYRFAPAGAVRLGPSPPNRRIYVTVAVRQQQDVHRVTAFAARHGIRVVAADKPNRLVVMYGTLRQFSRAFAVRFVRVRYRGVIYRGLTHAATVPRHLAGAIDYIHGLKTLPPPLTRRTMTNRVVVRGGIPRRMPGARRLGPSPRNRRIRVTLFVRSNADIPLLELFAANHRLRVVESNVLRRTMVVEGRIVNFSRAFGVRLFRYSLRGHIFRGVGRTAATVPPRVGRAIVYVHNLRTSPALPAAR